MTLASMTGFARCEGSTGEAGQTWVLEARSVNGRVLDIKYRYPQGFEAVERFGRDLAKGRFQRGQMNVTLTVNKTAAKAGLSLDQDALDFYLEASKAVTVRGHATPPSTAELFALRGVIAAAGDERTELTPADEAALGRDIERLFDALGAARQAEGKALDAILTGQLSAIAILVDKAKTLADQQVVLIRDRFVRRLSELMGEAGTADLNDRIMTEAAMLATKADVREELDRLTSHIDQGRQLLSADAPGRKLDFLAQEFMREANTLCSKSAFIELTQTGLELKAVIDQFREQTQNLE